jgi:hypothetical protein
MRVTVAGVGDPGRAQRTGLINAEPFSGQENL